MARTAIVIGGGIGGLAAALGLRRAGFEVTVHERAPELREVGAGLSIWSNALKALRRLGVADAALAAGAVFERMTTLDARGRELSDVRLDDLARRAGEPSLGMHRADLQRLLADALGRDRLRLGSACVAVTDGGRVELEGGRVEQADVVIGADGIRSAARASLLGPAPVREAGYFAWRGVAPLDRPELAGRTVFCMGRGAQMGLLPIGGGRVYWFLTKNGPPGGGDGPAGALAAARAAAAGWPELMRAVLEATPAAAVLRNDIVDRPPAATWGRGRVTLLGDAVHATTPNLGQGACMALEDAVVLADALARAADPVAGLRAYEAARRERTRFVIETSWRFGRLFQAEWWPLVRLRDWSSSTGFGQRQALATVERLLVHDLPALP